MRPPIKFRALSDKQALWEIEVIDRISELWECTVSDAQGALMAQEDMTNEAMEYQYEHGATPSEAAEEIIELFN